MQWILDDSRVDLLFAMSVSLQLVEFGKGTNMPEPKLPKPADSQEKTTRRPKALRTLVAAVGATALGLLGLPFAAANASTPPTAASQVNAQSNSGKPKLLLNQVGSQVQLAQGHESHASHALHESHASHASGGYR